MNIKNLFKFLFFIAMLAIYTGFYFTDPHAGTIANIFKWAARIFIPVFTIGLFVISNYIEKRKISKMAVWSIVLFSIGSMLLIFPIISHLYEAKNIGNLTQFHPYLQLKPTQMIIKSSKEQKKTFKIFCLGGSTTEFKDNKNVGWPSRLEKKLNALNPRIDFQVYNAGKQWYTSQHSLINYTINLRKFRPDMIIVMHGINDLLHNADFSSFSIDEFKDDYSHFIGPLKRLLKKKTLFGHAYSLVQTIWFYSPRQIINTNVFPGINSFKYNLNTLIKIAKTDGTEVILMTQPHLLKDRLSKQEQKALYMVNHEALGATKKWSPKTAKLGMQQYNKATKLVAKQNDVFLIDLTKSLPQELDYFNDEVHYTNKSFNILANFITNKLSKKLGSL